MLVGNYYYYQSYSREYYHKPWCISGFSSCHPVHVYEPYLCDFSWQRPNACSRPSTRNKGLLCRKSECTLRPYMPAGFCSATCVQCEHNQVCGVVPRGFGGPFGTARKRFLINAGHLKTLKFKCLLSSSVHMTIVSVRWRNSLSRVPAPASCVRSTR